MYGSRMIFGTSVIALLSMTALTESRYLCFASQRIESSKKNKDEITSFKLVGKSKGAFFPENFIIIYHSPHKWRYVIKDSEGSINRITLCDGKQAWSYLIVDSTPSNVKMWDVEKAAKNMAQIILILPCLAKQSLLLAMDLLTSLTNAGKRLLPNHSVKPFHN